MRPSPLTAAALALLLAATAAACAGTAPLHTTPHPPPPALEGHLAPAPSARAPFVTLLRDGTLWTAVPGAPARDTGLRPGAECADTMGIGSSSPVVSPDGRAIAFNAGDLVVASLDPPSPPVALTTHADPTAVCVQITGWTSDSRALLFHIGPHGSEDAPEPPAGTTLGFFLWDRDAGPPRHLPRLESADALMPNGRAVLQANHRPGPPMGRDLYHVTLDGDASLLATRDDAYAFGQLQVAADRIAFVARGTVELALLSAPSTPTVVATGDFAEHQWPRLSPDGQRIAWQRNALDDAGVRRASLVARLLNGAGDDTPGIIDLGPLAGGARVEVEWFDDTHLLVCDGAGVRLVDLDGAVVPIAGPGACFVPRQAR